MKRISTPAFFTGWTFQLKRWTSNDALDGRIVYDACNGGYEKDLASYANTFDLIVSHTFLEHVSDPETTHRLLAFSA